MTIAVLPLPTALMAAYLTQSQGEHPAATAPLSPSATLAADYASPASRPEA